MFFADPDSRIIDLQFSSYPELVVLGRDAPHPRQPHRFKHNQLALLANRSSGNRPEHAGMCGFDGPSDEKS
jgi:hypothetical protein